MRSLIIFKPLSTARKSNQHASLSPPSPPVANQKRTWCCQFFGGGGGKSHTLLSQGDGRDNKGRPHFCSPPTHSFPLSRKGCTFCSAGFSSRDKESNLSWGNTNKKTQQCGREGEPPYAFPCSLPPLAPGSPKAQPHSGLSSGWKQERSSFVTSVCVCGWGHICVCVCVCVWLGLIDSC